MNVSVLSIGFYAFSDIYFIKVDGIKDLLVWVDTSGHCRVITDKLHAWNGLKCGQNAFTGIQFDKEVYFFRVDHCCYILEARKDDSRSAALLYLQNV